MLVCVRFSCFLFLLVLLICFLSVFLTLLLLGFLAPVEIMCDRGPYLWLLLLPEEPCQILKIISKGPLGYHGNRYIGIFVFFRFSCVLFLRSPCLFLLCFLLFSCYLFIKVRWVFCPSLTDDSARNGYKNKNTLAFTKQLPET